MDTSKIANELAGKRVAIDDAVTTYSKNPWSHKSNWCHLVRNQLKHIGIDASVLTKSDDVHGYDAWLVLLPMEFNGTFNLFGGLDSVTVERVKRLRDFKGKIYSVNRDMPDVGQMIRSRSKEAQKFDIDANEITELCASIERVDLILDSDTLVVGDSHSISVYVPGSNIVRLDGKTLHGSLKDGGIPSLFPDGIKEVDRLITYFGNIDVRHHLCRLEDPVRASNELCKRYVSHLIDIQAEGTAKNVTVVKLLPIEHELRPIPKTGFYKNTPFFGSREQRVSVMEEFNKTLETLASKNGFEVISWPNEWYSMDPEEYAERFMEKPRSVHLSRTSYMYDFDTDLRNHVSIPKKSRGLF